MTCSETLQEHVQAKRIESYDYGSVAKKIK
jgi:hypothetical protein